MIFEIHVQETKRLQIIFFKNKNINKLPRESMLYRLHYYEQVFNKLNKYNVNESPLSNVYINNKRQC